MPALYCELLAEDKESNRIGRNYEEYFPNNKIYVKHFNGWPSADSDSTITKIYL